MRRAFKASLNHAPKERETRGRDRACLSSSKEFLTFRKPEERIAIDSEDLSIAANRARPTAFNTRSPRMRMQMRMQKATATAVDERRVFTAVRYKKTGGNSASE